jgi:hypothetical protein
MDSGSIGSVLFCSCARGASGNSSRVALRSAKAGRRSLRVQSDRHFGAKFLVHFITSVCRYSKLDRDASLAQHIFYVLELILRDATPTLSGAVSYCESCHHILRLEVGGREAAYLLQLLDAVAQWCA